MSMLPSFMTAPRIRIRIGNATIAYALGFDVRFGVKLDPVMVVGNFGPVAIEPTMIGPVSGTMQIMRLLSTGTLSKKLAASPGATTSLALSNAAIPEGAATGGATAGAQATNAIVNQGNLFSQLDPAKLLLSQTFDIDLYVMRPQASAYVALNAGSTLAAADLPLVLSKWMTIRDCRINSRNTNITMGQLVNQPLSYNGLLVVPQIPAGFDLDQSVKETA